MLRGEFAKPETDEERKARLAARPKLTEAEKVAKLEAQLAKRKTALSAGSTPATKEDHPTQPPAATPAKTVVAAKGKGGRRR